MGFGIVLFIFSFFMFLFVLFTLSWLKGMLYGKLLASGQDRLLDALSVNRNVMSILVVLCLFWVQVDVLNYIGAALFILMTYLQPHVWSTVIGGALDRMHSPYSEICAQELLKDNYMMTSNTVGKYLWLYLLSVLKGWTLFFEDFVEVCKIIYGMEVDYAKMRKELDQLWEEVSKSMGSDTLKSETHLDDLTDEEVLIVRERISSNYDPREMFNSVRRLPIFFKYQDYEDEDEFTPFLLESMVVLYNFFKTTIVAVSLGVLYFIYTMFLFKIQFLKQLSVWFVIGMLYFWLMSGFNFFVKRYQYGKFTSQIQSFWKSTNTCFWLIEGFLILLFFYYFLNSSQEPLYMYDYSAINLEFLVPLQVIFVNIVLLSVVIYFMYFTLLRMNSNGWAQLNIYLLVISIFVFFSFFLETYQFYYVISSFNERLWVFNEEENLWMIDVENPILSTKHQYLLVCLIAKYWHFLFIFLSWVFFLIKSFERSKVTYVLFGANLQNMVLLYVLNFACYIQWFKWLYSSFFDLPYTWFFTNIDNKFFFSLFAEIKLLLSSILNLNDSVYKFSTIMYRSLNLWNVDSLAMWKFI